jgi:hypothetical protein
MNTYQFLFQQLAWRSITHDIICEIIYNNVIQEVPRWLKVPYDTEFQASMTIFHYNIVGILIIPNFVSIISMDYIQTPVIRDKTCQLIHKKCH